eukprot:scaffold4145_cov115-Isochrysis_galbana.AAC.36
MCAVPRDRRGGTGVGAGSAALDGERRRAEAAAHSPPRPPCGLLLCILCMSCARLPVAAAAAPTSQHPTTYARLTWQ